MKKEWNELQHRTGIPISEYRKESKKKTVYASMIPRYIYLE